MGPPSWDGRWRRCGLDPDVVPAREDLAARIPVPRAVDQRSVEDFLVHSPAACTLRDAAGRHTWVNPVFLHLLGTTPARAVGSRWSDLQPPDLARLHEATDRRVVGDRRPVRWSTPLLGRDGVREVDGVTFPVALRDGTTGVGATFLDRPEQVRTRERRTGADRLRGDPVGRAAAPGPAVQVVGPGAAPCRGLSARETAVLEGVAQGWSSTQLARRLGLSAKGVDYHVSKLCDLVGAPNRAALVGRAYAGGLLVPGVWPPRADARTATSPGG